MYPDFHQPTTQTQRRMVEDFTRACDREPLRIPRHLRSTTFDEWEQFGRIMKVLREEVEEVDEAAATMDIGAAAHELADVLYMVRMLEVWLGIPLDEVFVEIHKANLTKINPATGRVYRDETGRVAKGPNYVKPDVMPVLRRALVG